MHKRIFRIIFGIIILSCMAFLVIFVIKNNKKVSDTEGTITVLVNDKDNTIKSKKRISYKKGDTLYQVLSDSYTLIYENTAYGHYLTGIEGDDFSIITDGKTSWIWLELFSIKDGKSYKEKISFDDYNEETLTTGIDGITLKDNMILALNERDANHTSSVLDSKVESKGTSGNIFQIVVFSLMGAIFLGVILYSFLKHEKITVRELAIMAFMTVILFVQEEVLSVLPNIQFTFLLLAVYVKVFGYKKTSLIVLVHVLLDNLIMGSLNPVVLIPMLAGYYIYITMMYYVKDKNIILITLTGILGSLVYCYMFMAVNALFLEVDVWAYFIADIPFEILLCLSTVLTLFYLYRPLTKKLLSLYNPEKPMENEDGEIM